MARAHVALELKSLSTSKGNVSLTTMSGGSTEDMPHLNSATLSEKCLEDTFVYSYKSIPILWSRFKPSPSAASSSMSESINQSLP